jgi:Ni,Fe-hydrogenase I cytochrome b subunit
MVLDGYLFLDLLLIILLLLLAVLLGNHRSSGLDFALFGKASCWFEFTLGFLGEMHLYHKVICLLFGYAISLLVVSV